MPKKKDFASKIIYLVLAVSVFTLVTLGIVGVLGNVFNEAETPSPTSSKEEEKPNETKRPSLVTPVETVHQNDPADNVDEPGEKETPVMGEATEPQEPTSAVKSYLRPSAGKLTKDYSGDILVYSLTMNDYRTHPGIDFSGEIGDSVRAFTDGVIEKVYEDPLMGNTVVISHEGGLKSYYQSLAGIYPAGIKEGASVKAGDVIGGIGESALIEIEEGPHLHFELKKDGMSVAASDYFSYQ